MIGLNNLWKRKPIVLIFMHLMQDLDIVLPLLESLKQRDDLELKVFVIDELLNESPRINETLDKLGIPFSKVSRLGVLTRLEPNLTGVKAVITASETTASPHKAAYTLTKRANRAGIFTYTLQHGFENIGLTYFDEVHTVDLIRFASKKILTWGNTSLLSPQIPLETKQLCVSVGCPKYISSNINEIQIPKQREYLIAIFENLHWHRYDDNYRQNFLSHLEKTALSFPNTTFLVKPHHAGLWLTNRYKGSLPSADNLVIANPKLPEWEPFTAPAIIQNADGVITTPSTVALDAARMDCPVSVVSYGLELSNYAPLSTINNQEDWTSFVKQLQLPEEKITAQNQARQFVDKNIISGDAIARIVELITADIFAKNTSKGKLITVGKYKNG
ncbi:MAG: hypothetical protein ACFB2X_22200 [Rivularia sp. (in: cyanobacteria)]